MKRFVLVLALSAMMVMPVLAERVTPETARKVATTFLNNNDAKSNALIDLSKAAGFENLYIFTTESSFVVMSADDCVKPVLGYSLTNKFAVEDMPENLRWWLQGYSDGIQDAIDYQTKATAETSKLWKDLSAGNSKTAKATSVVEALIQTEWDQNNRYNSACPLASGGPGGHVYAGCVATAMAQLIYFWNQGNTHPTIGIGSHTYIHNTYGVQSVNFAETTYDWNNMPNKLSSTSTAAQINAVATLMYHCGVAVDMDYGPGGSGAFSSDIPSALINYFNFSITAKYKRRYSNDSTQYWMQDLKDELNQNRPMEYSGTSNAGGGHSFICDGYNSDDKFHFNWGWNGSSNGFFSLDATNMNYINDQAAVFGIKPAFCSADAPADFSANWVSGTRNVDLSWDIVSNATGYKLFRNGNLIETFSSNDVTNFTDETIPYGTNIYHLRSLDSNGEMSLPSTYETVILDFPAPTNFQASLSASGTVNLSWNPSANYYNVYCNDVLIAAQVSGTSYDDTKPISGSVYYYVKAVDTFGDESVASNSVTVSIPYKTPAVNDLRASTSGQNVSLSWSAPTWCYPENESAVLSYGNQSIRSLWSIKYYGQRFPAENLSGYTNKSIYKVSTYVQFVGTYTVYIYTNSVEGLPDANSLMCTRTLKCSQGGWREIPVDPILITGNTDLWIVFEQTDTQSNYPVPSFDLSSYNANACFAGYDSPTMLLNPVDKVSWFIKAYLTDGVYTYNLYEGSTKLNGNTPISDTNYTIESDSKSNAIHNYTVKTNYYGGESEVSNTASLALGSNTLSSLDLEGNDNMTIGRNSTLNVGTLSNTNPANLVLEDGAQLFHNSANVKATVKKNITSYNNGGGWNFIASPVTGNIIPSDENGLLSGEYDLYFYEEPSHMWRNHKKHIVDGENQNAYSNFNIEFKKGYLYANSANTTLQFEGTLMPSDNTVSINNLSHLDETFNGFNLVGNPFACNANVNKDYYVVNGRNVSLAESGHVIAPCEGVFVKATETDESVTFSKASSAKGTNSKDCFDIVIMEGDQINQKDDPSTGSGTFGTMAVDRARVRIGGGIGMEKFRLDDNLSQISLWQNGQDFAVVYTNGEKELPLHFKAERNGTYTIGIEAHSLDLDYLHLIDNMTGNDVNLLATPNYTFEAKSSDYASRFRLLFSNSEDAVGDNEAFAYIQNGEIVITADAFDASLQVVDMMGRVVVCRDALRASAISTSGMPAGVYVLRLITAEKVKTQKIVIE